MRQAASAGDRELLGWRDSLRIGKQRLSSSILLSCSAGSDMAGRNDGI